MRLVLEQDLLNLAERLLAELRAIEHWNIAYWRNRHPDVYETKAFQARQSRRGEIIGQIALIRRSLLQIHPGEERVCPYCDGREYVFVEAFSHDGPVGTKTWVRTDCPLCNGTGRLYGGTESDGSPAIETI